MTKRLVLVMTGLVVLVALALAIPMAYVVSNSLEDAFVSELQVETLAAATTMAAQPSVDWQATAEQAAARTGARVVVVDDQLDLIADSDNSTLDRSFDRPEIEQALQGLVTSDVRPSVTVGENLRYVAAPIVQNYEIVAAVRLSMPEANVSDQIRAADVWLVVFVASVAIAAAVIAWLLARSLAAPLNRVAAVASDLPDDLALRADETSGPGEVRAVARALNSTAERLDSILQRTQRVAADASHHLRTPLTGIRLRLEAIDDTSADDAVRQDAQAALLEVDRLNHRIDQVLALARSDAGALPLVDEDVSAVVAGRLREAGAAFDERDIRVESSIEPHVHAQLPVGMVARVIDEILGNALAYARTCIDVRVTSTSRDAVITVDDDGPGLPSEEFEVVFDRFHRGSQSKPGGSGLGMALVREYATSVGGTATAEQSSQGGLRVKVTLPLSVDGAGHG